jgi:plastocyanin
LGQSGCLEKITPTTLQILKYSPVKRGYWSDLKMPYTIKRFNWVIFIAVVAMFIGTAGCTSYSQGPVAPTTTPLEIPGTPTITIQNFAFSPATITVPRGATVTWVNKDSASHTIVSDAQGSVAQGAVFTSNSLANGASYSFKFDSPGTYPYHCSIHPTMKATVIVT